jgi:hypothetical protein
MWAGINVTLASGSVFRRTNPTCRRSDRISTGDHGPPFTVKMGYAVQRVRNGSLVLPPSAHLAAKA